MFNCNGNNFYNGIGSMQPIFEPISMVECYKGQCNHTDIYGNICYSNNGNTRVCCICGKELNDIDFELYNYSKSLETRIRDGLNLDNFDLEKDIESINDINVRTILINVYNECIRYPDSLYANNYIIKYGAISGVIAEAANNARKRPGIEYTANDSTCSALEMLKSKEAYEFEKAKCCHVDSISKKINVVKDCSIKTCSCGRCESTWNECEDLAADIPYVNECSLIIDDLKSKMKNVDSFNIIGMYYSDIIDRLSQSMKLMLYFAKNKDDFNYSKDMLPNIISAKKMYQKSIATIIKEDQSNSSLDIYEESRIKSRKYSMYWEELSTGKAVEKQYLEKAIGVAQYLKHEYGGNIPDDYYNAIVDVVALTPFIDDALQESVLQRGYKK